jgi:hypothetical protein
MLALSSKKHAPRKSIPMLRVRDEKLRVPASEVVPIGHRVVFLKNETP